MCTVRMRGRGPMRLACGLQAQFQYAEISAPCPPAAAASARACACPRRAPLPPPAGVRCVRGSGLSVRAGFERRARQPACARKAAAERSAPAAAPSPSRPDRAPRRLWIAPRTLYPAIMRSTGAWHCPREYWRCFTSSRSTAGSSGSLSGTPRPACMLYTLGSRREARRAMVGPLEGEAEARSDHCVLARACCAGDLCGGGCRRCVL